MEKTNPAVNSSQIINIQDKVGSQNITNSMNTVTKMSPAEIIAKLPPDSIVIGDKFLVGRTLGEGSFG